MKCEEMEELLADYIQGTLSPGQRTQVEQHLAMCAQCSEEVSLWNKLAALPEQQPSPALRARFTDMLEAYQAGQSTKPSGWRGMVPPALLHGGWRTPAAGMAWAMLFLVIGFFAGRSMNRPEPNTGQIASVQNELANMRQMLELSLLQQQSASERLQAVSMTTQDSRPDPKVLGALVHALRYDNSVNVRLAALDALGHYHNQPDVRTGLREALQPQQSPLVQVALIDLMVDLRDTTMVDRLREFERDPNVNPTVRQRAAWGVKQLT
jgi:anti-sigma-K factor RskA